VTWKGKDNRYSIIAYVKNAFNTQGYDGGSTSTRYAGVYSAATIAAAGMTPGLPGGIPGTFNAVQKTSTFSGVGTTYYLTPPRTFGVEFQYRF
jgi:iron complex outermembrane receptor protein